MRENHRLAACDYGVFGLVPAERLANTAITALLSRNHDKDQRRAKKKCVVLRFLTRHDRNNRGGEHARRPVWGDFIMPDGEFRDMLEKFVGEGQMTPEQRHHAVQTMRAPQPRHVPR